MTQPDSKSAAGATGREGRAAALGTAGKGATGGKAAAAAAADANASRTCHESECCSNRQVALPQIQVTNFWLVCLSKLPLNITGQVSTWLGDIQVVWGCIGKTHALVTITLMRSALLSEP